MTDSEQGRNESSGADCHECARLRGRLENLLAYLQKEFDPSLSAVLGMAELLQGAGLNGEQAEYLRTLRDAAEGMGMVLRGVSDMAWSGTQTALGSEEDFDLRVLVHELVELSRIHVRRGNSSFSSTVDDRVPSLVRGIPSILRRVLRSFLSRVLAAPGGSAIRLDLGQDSRRDGSVTVRLEVGIDTRVAVPDEDFMRTCRELAERQGGQAGFTAGEESLFWATFVYPELDVRPASFPPPSSITGQRILVVDGDAAWRGMLREYCYLWGCRFAESVGGMTALEQMRTDAELGETQDFVLAGSDLGGMDAADFGRVVRDDPALSGVMLVVLANSARPGDAARMAEAGYDAFLSRPIDQRRIFDALCLVLGARQSGERVPLVTRHVVAEECKRRKLVMVACGDPGSRGGLAQMLNQWGYAHTECATGQAALGLLRENSYSLLIVDEELGDMSAAELLQAVREPASGRDDLPAVALGDGGDSATRYAEAGFDEVMSRPLDVQGAFWILEKYVQPNEPGKCDFGLRSLDVERLLEQLDNDRDLLAEVLQTFLFQGRARVDEFLRALDDGDGTLAEQKANALRGVAGNIRAEGVRVLAEMAEQACRKSDLLKARGLGAEILRELWKVEQAAVLV